MTARPAEQVTDLRSLALTKDAVLWRNSGDLRTSLVSVRALLLQVAYPMVGAGVGEHSVHKTDPWGRLYRSLKSLMTQIYGSERAVAEGRRLQELHRDIKGLDAQGRRYSALNPEAFYWVHATVLEGALVFQDRFDRPLDDEELDRAPRGGGDPQVHRGTDRRHPAAAGAGSSPGPGRRAVRGDDQRAAPTAPAFAGALTAVPPKGGIVCAGSRAMVNLAPSSGRWASG